MPKGIRGDDITVAMMWSMRSKTFPEAVFKKFLGVHLQMFSPIQEARRIKWFFLAFLNPGDTFLALSLNAGGHLTHGSFVNLSGKWFNAVHYGVQEETGLINMEEVEALAHKHRPKLLIKGASACARLIDFEGIRTTGPMTTGPGLLGSDHWAHGLLGP